MNPIPIFDSLAHSTLSGTWSVRTKVLPTFEQLNKELINNQYMGACAIGMGHMDCYEHEAFLMECGKYEKLFPIAYFVLQINWKKELLYIKKLGYKGIKIHPRFSGLNSCEIDLSPIFQEAAKLNLVVFYCTYHHCQLHTYPTQDPFYQLVGWLQKAPDTKIILVHGGDVRLLQYAELVRFNPNLLLDLSLTMMKYQGSSVDMDIQFLFNLFDRRICIGTDFPEYTHKEVRERFNHFAKQISLEKKENIAYKNLCSFLGI